MSTMETKIRKRGKQPRNEEFVKKKKVKREKEKELQQESYQSAIGSLVDDDGVEVDTVIEGATESGEKTSCEVCVRKRRAVKKNGEGGEIWFSLEVDGVPLNQRQFPIVLGDRVP